MQGGFATLADLHATARDRVKLEDFGDPAYLEGLERLLGAIEVDQVSFGPEGRERVQGMIVDTLVARLMAEAGWRRRPDSLDRPIRRPLIITGLPRTGTTALHRLLMVDATFQGLPRWLAFAPMPRPPVETWADNPAFQMVVQRAAAQFSGDRELSAIHHMVADEVDECIHLLKQDFCNNYWGSSLPVPTYDDWWLRQDERGSYHRLRRLLQLIGADDQQRPWLLKNPGHLMHLPALLEQFPDAVVVITHRDPFTAVASLSSLMAQLHRRNAGGPIDQRAIARREVKVWSIAARRAEAARAALPAGQFIDVQQKDLHRDPIGVVRQIYTALGSPLASATEEAMRRRIAEDPERSRGEHRYDPADFGLDPDEVSAAFASTD